jgi:hypothetical protein
MEHIRQRSMQSDNWNYLKWHRIITVGSSDKGTSHSEDKVDLTPRSSRRPEYSH